MIVTWKKSQISIFKDNVPRKTNVSIKWYLNKKLLFKVKISTKMYEKTIYIHTDMYTLKNL